MMSNFFGRKVLIFFFIFPLLFFSNCQLIGSFAWWQQEQDWLHYRGINGNGFIDNNLNTPLALRWKIPLQAGKSTEKKTRAFNPPLVEDQVIYFGSVDKNFYALDLKSGYMRWIFPTRNEVNSVPYLMDDKIFFGSNDGRVYAVSKKSGDEIWNFQSGQTVQSLLSGWQDNLIFTSDQGQTFFLDQKNGEIRHQIPNETWSHHTFQIYDGVMYWAPFRGGFGAYDIGERKFLWVIQVPIDRAVWYSYPALDEDMVYFASNFFTNRLGGGEILLSYYALDRRTGKNVWQAESQFKFPPWVPADSYNGFFRHIELLDYLAPAVWKDLIIYTSGDRVVRAFDAKNGDLAWEKELPALTSSAPTIGKDKIYFGVHAYQTMDNQIRAPQIMCLSVVNGKILWQVDTEGAILAAPVIAGDALFFGTDENIFYVLEEVF